MITLGNFNLFYGNNEDGKTLTLEAIVSFLLGKNRKIFPGIERVMHQPEGYLMLENEAGEVFKLPEAGLIPDLIGVTPEEYRNLFIIRNSDLTISREAAFYNNLTERLTGLRTGYIQQIKNRLREFAQFTNGLDTANTRENQYLKKRLEQAEGLLEQTRDFYHEAASSGYDVLEENLVQMQSRLREVEETISRMGKARLRQRYETGRKHLDLIHNYQLELEQLGQYTQGELILWQQTQAFIEEKDTELKLTIQQCKACEDELVEEQKKLMELRNFSEISRQRKAGIDERLKPLLQQLGEFKKGYARLNAGRRFFILLISMFVLFALVAFGGMAWQPSLFFIVLAAISGTAAFGLTLFYYFHFINPQGEAEEREQQVMHLAGELGLPGEDVNQVQEQIQRFEETYQRQQQRIVESEGRVAFLENSFRALRDERIESLESRLEKSRQTIQDIRTRRQVNDLEEYQQRYQELRQVEQKINESAAVLKNLFGTRGDTLKAQMEFWDSEVAELRKHQFAAVDITFDDQKFEKLTGERQSLQEEIETLQRQLHDFQNRLGELERRAYEAVLPTDDRFPGRTLNDLKQLEQMLQQFLEEVDRQQQTARTAIEIFDEIEQDERQRISELFGEESRVAELFGQITDGLYPVVYYDTASNDVRIRRSDGKILPPNWLSSGAYDQLYFAIRLALGEKLLQGEKGFFILDDPFLKSDTGRLRQQMEMLVTLADEGWQILYFSAKDEVVSALHHHIESGKVILQAAPQVDFKIDT